MRCKSLVTGRVSNDTSSAPKDADSGSLSGGFSLRAKIFSSGHKYKNELANDQDGEDPDYLAERNGF